MHIFHHRKLFTGIRIKSVFLKLTAGAAFRGAHSLLGTALFIHKTIKLLNPHEKSAAKILTSVGVGSEKRF